ncbi:hypothetical protein [Flavobacterium sp.]|uniref:hypothetical protein n=1 Tax=Flavobacterium sp. TaxID=239 RepID=UPI00391B0EC7
MKNKPFLQPLIHKETITPLEMNDFHLIFSKTFKLINKRNFEFTEESKNLYNTLVHYFYGMDDFYESPCLIKDKNNPSLDKGLIIIGNPGVGKSAILKTFEYIFWNLCIFNPNFSFKMISANDMVSQFESLQNPLERKEFNSLMGKAFKCFDDLKSEREASNFGKVNVMKEVLFNRYDNESRTIITCNYDDNFPDDYEKSLDEFGIKYDSRIYDRIFEMFNIIEVKGKSFRR